MSAPQPPAPTPVPPATSVPPVPTLPKVVTAATGAQIPPTTPAAVTPPATPALAPTPTVATTQTSPAPIPTESAAPESPTAAQKNTNTVPSTPTPAVIAEALKQAKAAHLKAKLNHIFGRFRRHVAFFIVCVLFLYTNIWMFARAWQQEKAGEKENWFHEGLFLVLMVISLIVFYYRLYRKSEVYQNALIKKGAAEKAAREARLKLEEEQKKQAFMGLIKDFQSANSYDQKSATMAKLLTVGLESNLLRQEAINLLCDLNEWMSDHKTFMSTQNLIIWRLKGSLFEQSERFQVDSATQDLSIKAINIIEAIIKKHITEFTNGRTKSELDLSGKTVPTLTLTAQTIPQGCLKLEGANLWQSSFAETTLTGLSFANCDLQSASFWRAQLENINFENVNLQFSKLRTNLQSVQNLTASQFFGSKEWELCYLSPEQQTAFFTDTENMPDGAKSNWDSAEPRRRKLYFHLLRQQADALE